jgi:hypothetical protein
MEWKQYFITNKQAKQTLLPKSASELYWPSDRCLSGKLVPTFYVDRGGYVVSVTNPYSCILSFLDWSLYFFFQVVPQLYSQDWVGL